MLAVRISVVSHVTIIWVVGSYLFVASVSGCITGYTDLCVYKRCVFEGRMHRTINYT